jgi:ABC-type uncharacterized transport system involved in gliding motility auxiliary subunit
MKKLLSYLWIPGVALLFAGVVAYYATSQLTALPTILLVAGLLFLAGQAAVRFEEFKRWLGARSTRFGTNAVVIVLMAAGILVLVNMIVARHTWRVDTTEAKQFSLSDQTRKILRNLEDELRITAFYKDNAQARMLDLLTEYSNASPKVKFEFIDPDKKPAVAQNYGITAYNTTVIEYRGRTERITTSTEEDLTNAIIKVTRERKKKILFLTGHGEKDIESDERNGFSAVKKAIEKENYDVETLLLAEKTEFPEDGDVLVIAGPQKPLLPNEIQMINSFVDRGGKVLALLDPGYDHGLTDFLADWGVEVSDDLVVDVSGIGRLFGAGAQMPIVAQYENHAITERFGNVMTAYPLAAAVKINSSTDSGVTVKALAKTTASSWAEKDGISKFQRREPIEFNPGEDLKGPITIAAVATKTINSSDGETSVSNGTSRDARLVVFGDSDFASNNFFNFQANGDLFMNAISWLAEEEDLVSIRPRNPADRRLILTEAQSRLIFIFSVIVLPAVVLGTAITVYVKRR